MKGPNVGVVVTSPEVQIEMSGLAGEQNGIELVGVVVELASEVLVGRRHA